MIRESGEEPERKSEEECTSGDCQNQQGERAWVLLGGEYHKLLSTGPCAGQDG